jgi:hypothetical protein
MIHGTRLMTFREAIDEYCQDEFNPRETLMTHLTGKRSLFSLETMMDGLQWLVEETDKVLQMSREAMGIASPVLRQVEAVERDIPSDLSKEIMLASQNLSRKADELMSAPCVNAVGEYFMSVWVPLLLEWQVVADRFSDRTWAEAYRLQLGEQGFGAMGQLCLSLVNVLEKGRKKVRDLLQAQSKDATHPLPRQAGSKKRN